MIGVGYSVANETNKRNLLMHGVPALPGKFAIGTFCSALLIALIGMTAPAAAQESAWHETEQTAARLLSATQAVGDGGTLRMGLQFRMRPGWKIYWRTPGDAGLPPKPKWQQSENVKTAEIRWPAPERFSVLGFETLGYKDEVVFPVDVNVTDPGKPVNVKAVVPYLTCDDICIPYVAKLDLTLPAGKAEPSEYAHLIGRFAAKVPASADGQGLALASMAALETKAPAPVKAAHGKAKALAPQATLNIVATSLTPFKKPDVFLEGPPELTYSKPRVSLMDDGTKALLEVDVIGAEALNGGAASLLKETLVATLVDGERSAERRVIVTPKLADAEKGMDRSLLSALILALLGGLILNLMPCVLPVLSIKVLGLAGHGGGNKSDVRWSFISSSLGIVSSFMALATALVAAKAAGMQIGWGIQFQQPWFLAAMAVIVAVFACNLFGFFEFRMPGAVGRLDEAAAHHKGLTGHFLQGALATLLATPCSAPFLGTAVGFALARGTADIYAIFAGLGVGLALPFLTVALFPALATRLPKPGAWMVRLRQLMGLALAATAGWLLWVISGILSINAAAVLAALVIAIGLVFYLAQRSGGPMARLVPALPAVLAALVIAGAAFAPHGKAKVGSVASAQLTAAWIPFNETKLRELVAQGRTVLVDVTADWCITCEVNKRLVLNQGAVAEAIEAGAVIAMVADWTRPDPLIAAYLARFGRYGIPFNAVYGPAAEQGIPLPELLTETLVTNAMLRAGEIATAGR
ncbi:MAG: protein-disulfide reductase DsbD domain-containing protein [Rhodospirillaceae bacterium]